MYLTVVGLLGLGIGALLRNTPAAISSSSASCSCCRNCRFPAVILGRSDHPLPASTLDSHHQN